MVDAGRYDTGPGRERRLLGPRRLAERVRELQVSRARAIDEAATMMRRLERDLHDGAQIRWPRWR